MVFILVGVAALVVAIIGGIVIGRLVAPAILGDLEIRIDDLERDELQRGGG